MSAQAQRILIRTTPVLLLPFLLFANGPIRVDSRLVLVPVIVTAPRGELVTDLDREHFRLYEEGVEQRITHFYRDELPLSAAFVFDVSSSMARSLPHAAGAVARVLESANPEDEFALVRFNHKPELAVPFTRDTGRIRSALMAKSARGNTALLDALYFALHEMKKAKNPRRAIVILSDGGDNRSRYSERELKRLIVEADVQIFSIARIRWIPPRTVLVNDEREGARLLESLADLTGGAHFVAQTGDEVREAVEKVNEALRSHYVLGYAPAAAAPDGKYRRVKVEVEGSPGKPRLRAAWRQGYSN